MEMIQQGLYYITAQKNGLDKNGNTRYVYSVFKKKSHGYYCMNESIAKKDSDIKRNKYGIIISNENKNQFISTLVNIATRTEL